MLGYRVVVKKSPEAKHLAIGLTMGSVCEYRSLAMAAPRRNQFRADSGPPQNSGHIGQVRVNFGNMRVDLIVRHL
jgi:hypothetical protein